MVIYDHAAKYAPWFPGLKGVPEFVEVKKLVNSINDQESNTFLKQSDEAINPKKDLLNLDEIIHLQF